MNYKLKLNAVREILGLAVKLESAKTNEGVVLEFEKLEIGFPVFVVSEDGTQVPATGDVTLEDGTILKLDEAGLITEIVAVEEVADIEVIAEEVVEEPKEEEDVRMNDKFTAIFEAIEEVAEEVATIKEEMAAYKTKMDKFSKAPGSAAITNIINPKEVEVMDAFEFKLKAIKNAMKN